MGKEKKELRMAKEKMGQRKTKCIRNRKWWLRWWKKGQKETRRRDGNRE